MYKMGCVMEKFDQKKYIQEYCKEKYHRVPLDLKKEDYDQMQKRAKEKGFEKVNAYLKDLIKKDIERK